MRIFFAALCIEVANNSPLLQHMMIKMNAVASKTESRQYNTHTPTYVVGV